MTAPERFAQLSDSSPSIHDPFETSGHENCCYAKSLLAPNDQAPVATLRRGFIRALTDCPTVPPGSDRGDRYSMSVLGQTYLLVGYSASQASDCGDEAHLIDRRLVRVRFRKFITDFIDLTLTCGCVEPFTISVACGVLKCPLVFADQGKSDKRPSPQTNKAGNITKGRRLTYVEYELSRCCYRSTRLMRGSLPLAWCFANSKEERPWAEFLRFSP